MMMNGMEEDAAIGRFNYYKPILTGNSTDKKLRKELDGLIEKYIDWQ